MSSLNSILTRVNKAVAEPFDWSMVDRAMVDLHTKLTEPEWAIEDEALREEIEKLVVQIAAQRYLGSITESGGVDGKR